MNIQPKSKEVIQAQAAAFAAESQESPESRHAHEFLGGLGVDNTIALGEDYVSFLRQVGGSRYDSIKGRTDVLRMYQAFIPQVHELIGELKGTNVRQKKEHPMHLASGSSVEVFRITQSDKDYVVRLGKTGDAGSTIDGYVAGSVLARGMKHIEQVVAVSYEDGAVVSELMPGKELAEVSAEDAKGVTQQQIDELVDTLIEARSRGLIIDMKSRNILYDPDEGFGIVDVDSQRTASLHPDDKSAGACVGGMFATVSATARDDDSGTAKQARQAIQEKYITAVKNKLKGDDLEKALGRIERKISLAKQLEGLRNSRHQ